MLCENDKAVRMSVDHKATNESEIKRVKEMGGIIIRGRVSGSLAVTRALGDLELKTEVMNILGKSKNARKRITSQIYLLSFNRES